MSGTSIRIPGLCSLYCDCGYTQAPLYEEDLEKRTKDCKEENNQEEEISRYIACDKCLGWYHPSCVNVASVDELKHATFYCSNCNPSGSFKSNTSITQIVPIVPTGGVGTNTTSTTSTASTAATVSRGKERKGKQERKRPRSAKEAQITKVDPPGVPGTIDGDLYCCLNNDTPMHVSEKCDVNLEDLLQLNVPNFPGLKQNSKLYPYTMLSLPPPTPGMLTNGKKTPELLASTDTFNVTVQLAENRRIEILKTNFFNNTTTAPILLQQHHTTTLLLLQHTTTITRTTTPRHHTTQLNTNHLPPPTDGIYISMQGERCSNIAERFAIPQRTLIDQNRSIHPTLRSTSRLFEGTNIRIPGMWNM